MEESIYPAQKTPSPSSHALLKGKSIQLLQVQLDAFYSEIRAELQNELTIKQVCLQKQRDHNHIQLLGKGTYMDLLHHATRGM